MEPRILCYGDSNTWGFDPRSWCGGRYASPWPELLAKETGWEVLNCGQNGRSIPDREYEYAQFRGLERWERPDALLVMLGTNDLLCGDSAETAAKRMESFLTQSVTPRLLLIAPPPLQRGAWVPEDGLVSASRELAARYRELAARLGLGFADAGAWGVGLAFDGVHFTETGHARFAEGVAAAVRESVLSR